MSDGVTLLGMVRFGFVRVVALGVSVAIACKFEGALEPEEPQTTAGNPGETNAGAPTSQGDGGRGSGGPKVPSSMGGELSTGGGDDAAGQAGRTFAPAGGAGAGGQTSGDAGAGGAPLASECNISEGCEAGCQQASATCELIDMPFACEFAKYAGTSHDLSCGELATVGEVECGGCGLVDVKVYFDGQGCWQGIPDCELVEFDDILFRIND